MKKIILTLAAFTTIGMCYAIEFKTLDEFKKYTEELNGATITIDISGTESTPNVFDTKFKNAPNSTSVSTFQKKVKYVKFNNMPNYVEFKEGYDKIEAPDGSFSNVTANGQKVGSKTVKKDNKFYLP